MKTLVSHFIDSQLKEKRNQLAISIRFIKHALGDYWDALSRFEKGRLKNYLISQKEKAKNLTKVRNEIKRESNV